MVRDEYAPTRAPSLVEALSAVDNPLQTLRQLHSHLSALTDELRARVAARRAAREEELQLYHGAAWCKQACGSGALMMDMVGRRDAAADAAPL